MDGKIPEKSVKGGFHVVDYRKLRLNNLNSPEFSHVKLLIFWIPYFACWLLSNKLTAGSYNLVSCALDSRIPFCEWFVIPYVAWYAGLFGIVAYLFFFDVRGFRKLMFYVMLTFTAAIITFTVYPTGVDLRPASFDHANLATWLIGKIYAFDEPTNACPSVHVIGAFAVAFGAWSTPRLQKRGWKILFFMLASLVSVSTVFVKQHSVVDVICGLIVSAIGYVLVYVIPWKET